MRPIDPLCSTDFVTDAVLLAVAVDPVVAVVVGETKWPHLGRSGNGTEEEDRDRHTHHQHPLIDEGVSVMLDPDVDGDGHGAVGSAGVAGCPGKPGFSTLANDCDDTNPAILPGAQVCTVGGGIKICTSDGSYKTSSCGQMTCRPQPNGTGICVP